MRLVCSDVLLRFLGVNGYVLGLVVHISYHYQCGKGKMNEHHVVFGSYIAIIF
jgi:hypothetical protein